MEYQNRKKALGVIEIIKNDSVQIKILAVKEKGYKTVTEEEAKKLFPPNGLVFGASFLKEYPHLHEKDLIDIDCLQSHQVNERDFNKDRFIVCRGSAKKHSVNIFPIRKYSIQNGFIDLSEIIVENNGFEGDFYGSTPSKIFGKLRFRNGKYSPAKDKRINMWDLNECKTIIHNHDIYLLNEPTEKSIPLDCMDDKQLFDWFRDELKKIDPDYVKILDQKARWRSEIPKLFSQLSEERYEVDKIRFGRIIEKIKYLNLSISDIKFLIENSESLNTAFTQAIENHKEAFKSVYKKQLDDYKTEIHKQEEQLNNEIKFLEEKKSLNETTLTNLKREIKDLQLNIEQLNLNKDRIIADFSIIKDVLGYEIKTSNLMITENSFVIEQIEEPENTMPFTNKDDFTKSLQYQLQKFELFPNLAKRAIDIVSVFKAILVADIKIALAFLETTNSATYIIQNVEPDWLHFRNLWENGLGAIWQSAHHNPERLHFLILEDINLSSPECYGRPLLDVISGVRKKIPFGKTEYPDNLRIITTVAPTENPEIGLPLNKATFSGWGAIGFNCDIYRHSEIEFEKPEGFIDKSSFSKLKPDEFEIDEIKAVVHQEISKLFETE